MARKLKVGLDYFPIDTDILLEPKIKRLMKLYGAEFLSIYICFLTMVYSAGYYLEMNLDELAEDIWSSLDFKNFDLDQGYVKSILQKMVDCNMIDSVSLELDEVITSKAIQKQFLASTYRRKKADRPYWILTPEEEEKVKKNYGINANKQEDISVNNNSINVDINEENADDNSIIANKSTQSKSKSNSKSKKKRRDILDRFDKGNLPFPVNYYVSCLIDDHILSIYEPFLEEFNNFIEETLSLWDKELFKRCFRYTRDQINRSHSDIDDICSYFVIALENNLEKMEGYDERMEKWSSEVEKYLESIGYKK